MLEDTEGSRVSGFQILGSGRVTRRGIAHDDKRLRIGERVTWWGYGPV